MIRIYNLGTVLDGVAADASEANRTATIDLLARPYECDQGAVMAHMLRCRISLVQNSATEITAVLQVSKDGGSSYAPVSAGILAGTGVNTLHDYTLSRLHAEGDVIDFQLDVRGCTHAKVILAATGGVTADELSLSGIVVQEI